jgi:hypothetical protein
VQLRALLAMKVRLQAKEGEAKGIALHSEYARDEAGLLAGDPISLAVLMNDEARAR